MTPAPTRWPRPAAAHVVLAIAAVGFVASSLVWGTARLDALQFHQRDASYFLQFAARALEGEQQDRIYLNPEGRNLFKLAGAEGERSVHQSIHFEPVKYLYALWFLVDSSPRSLMVMYAVLWMLPWLFILRWFPQRDRKDSWFLVLVFVAYCAYPSAIGAPSFEFRPFGLLIPYWMALVVAIRFGASQRWVLLLLHLLFLIREEALIFGALAIVLWMMVRKESSRRLWIHYSLWVAMTFAYFWWTGYDWEPGAPRRAGLLLLLTAGAVLARRHFARAWDWLKASPYGPSILIAMILGPLLLEANYMLGELTWREAVKDLLYIPRWKIFWDVVLLTLLLSWPCLRPRVAHRVSVAVVVAVLMFVPFHLLGSESTWQRWRLFQRERVRTDLVWDHSERADLRDGGLLTDYQTNLPFFDHPRVYVYQRLPFFLIEGRDRFWPRNETVLRELIEEEIDWVLIHERNETEVRDLVEAAGRSVAVADSSPTYLLWRLD